MAALEAGRRRSLVTVVLAALAVVVVLLGLAAYMVVVVLDDDGPTWTCEVTPEGQRLREETDVGSDHLPDGRAGDRYESESGCLEPDAAER